MSDSKLVRGTLVLSVATLLSKVLGLIYLFPFTAIVGQTGIALYNYGYLPYTVILSLATLGVPLAVSKFVSKYNALGDYRTGFRLFTSGLVVMAITGLISFILLFSLAPALAPLVVEDPSKLEGNSFEDIVFTIRMVSLALIVVPMMSMTRGYFQGFQQMEPTAISQVIEQIVRVIFILTVTFTIVKVMKGDTGLAVGLATFGAFVGALGGSAVLFFYWRKNKETVVEKIKHSRVDHRLSLTAMYKELLAYALPLSFVGLAIPLYQLIDLVTFNRTLQGIGYRQEEVEVLFGVFTGTAHKIILIPMAVATALSITLVPTITKSYTNGDHRLLQRQITQTYQIILFLAIPAAIGLSILAYPIFGGLYGVAHIDVGGYILRYYGPITLFFSLFSVTAAILQGMNKQKIAVFALAVGLFVKLVTNTLFLKGIGPLGGVLATYCGYILSTAITVWAIGKCAHFSYVFIAKRALLILIFSTMMAIGVSIINAGMQRLFPLTSWSNTLVVLLVTVMSGIVIYMYLSYRSNLAGQVLGSRFRFLNRQRDSD